MPTLKKIYMQSRRSNIRKKQRRLQFYFFFNGPQQYNNIHIIACAPISIYEYNNIYL